MQVITKYFCPFLLTRNEIFYLVHSLLVLQSLGKPSCTKWMEKRINLVLILLLSLFKPSHVPSHLMKFVFDHSNLHRPPIPSLASLIEVHTGAMVTAAVQMAGGTQCKLLYHRLSLNPPWNSFFDIQAYKLLMHIIRSSTLTSGMFQNGVGFLTEDTMSCAESNIWVIWERRR